MTPLVIRGDARRLPLADASVDAVVTDPPYGLEFMGKDWDRPWAVGTSRTGYTDGAERLARPSHGDNRNANCRSCGGRQRGARRCSCVQPAWDRHPRQDMVAFGEWCQDWAVEVLRVAKPGAFLLAFGGTRTYHRLTCAIEDAGWLIDDSIGVLGWMHAQGFPKGKAKLKPAWEPIVVARKPGPTVLNVDACRVATDESTQRRNTAPRFTGTSYAGGEVYAPEPWTSGGTAGRWPTNLVFVHHPDCADRCVPGCHVAELDAQSGTQRDGVTVRRNRAPVGQEANPHGIYGSHVRPAGPDSGYGGSGGASRFYPTFRFNPKADTAERPVLTWPDSTVLAHPTVKPVDLMRWLVRLVTPPGGTVLDPFAGSGATLQAAHVEGFRAVGVELDTDHCALIRERLSWPVRIDRDGKFERLRPAAVPEGQFDLLALEEPA